MTKSTNVVQKGATTDIDFARQVEHIKGLEKHYPKNIHVFEDKKEFFETWATKYHGSHFHNLFHIDSVKNKCVTRPTLKLVPQFWGASAEILEEMVDNGYLGKEYRVIDEAQEECEHVNIPTHYESVCKEAAADTTYLIQNVWKVGVGIDLLVLKDEDKMLLVFTSQFLNDNFILKNAYSDKQTVAEDYVQTLKEIKELKRKKELYEEWLELK